MNYNRFFSFGCSYTQHIWPTWADIIAIDLDIPYQNWGRSGAGNQFISSKLIECDQFNSLNKDDLVIVLWTGWNREDRYYNNCWQCYGTIFNNAFFDKSFIEKYWSLENDLIRNSTLITLVSRAFKDIIKYQAYSMDPQFENSWTNRFNLKKIEEPMEKIKKSYLTKELDLEIFAENGYNINPFDGCVNESHPDVLVHLSFVKNKIYPKLNLELKSSTIDLINDYYNNVKSICKYTDSRNEMQNKIVRINEIYNINTGFYHGL